MWFQNARAKFRRGKVTKDPVKKSESNSDTKSDMPGSSGESGEDTVQSIVSNHEHNGSYFGDHRAESEREGENKLFMTSISRGVLK